ncbi:hypothetical protein Vretimale_9291 [Volvox reticuliferus]|nr:hypothetical protein Vretifemale_10158 [Volvox reticuliferus]GIM04785.1 hypothetical protein Vretimale_9291 [Volvox reticuliferus]
MGPESSCQVILDMVEILTDAARERRKIPGGGGAASTDWLPQRLEDAPMKTRSQVDVANVRAAMIPRPWWTPQNLACWGWTAVTRAGAAVVHFQESLWMLSTGIRCTRSLKSRSCSGRGCVGSSVKRSRHADRRRAVSAAGAASGTEKEMDERTSRAQPRPVIASRIMSVNPRVMLLHRPDAGLQAQPPACTGPREQHLPPNTASMAPLQVAAAVCCGTPIHYSTVVGSKHLCRADSRDSRRPLGATCECYRGDEMSCTEGGPLTKVMLRHDSGLVRTCTLTEISDPQGARPGPSEPPKTCRRDQCHLHLTLRRDIQLLDSIKTESAAAEPLNVKVDPEAVRRGPGLVLVDQRTRADFCLSGQRPIPVVVVDDPLVAGELQAAFADTQGATGCSAANWDDFLIDLGVFLKRTAELRSAADPVLLHVYAGRLRHGPAPPCCCGDCSQKISAMHVSRGYSGVNTTSLSPPCVACSLVQLKEALNQYLSASRSLFLGERLLRHATASGWNHTASYIWSRMADLHRIDALLGTGSGGDSQCCDHSNTNSTSRTLTYHKRVQLLLRACLRVFVGMPNRQGAKTRPPLFFPPYLVLILILALVMAWLLGV